MLFQLSGVVSTTGTTSLSLGDQFYPLVTHTHRVTVANKSLKMLLHNKVGSASIKLKQTLCRRERYVSVLCICCV